MSAFRLTLHGNILAVLLVLFWCYTMPSFAAEDHVDPNTVQWWGHAYRYPKAGWINVHIEGDPHEMGLQHGRLLAPEIAAYVQGLAQFYNPKTPEKGWSKIRNQSKALFIRGFTPEQLDEMAGIAEGASASGARFAGRPLDLLDIAVLNLTNEIDSLDSALDATPNGSEVFKKTTKTPASTLAPSHGPIRCDAFAAVGPATKDGKIVFGHITMFDLLPGNYYNVWLDVKPSHGHHFVMQTTPGGIHSGMDYSINDAGIMLSETTIGQTRFESQGIPLASRIRQAQQYAGSIEEAASFLTTNGNGLSTTEWILADVKKNEIALLTLGTHESKLYRSSKKEWISGAEGFYWSNNNTKDRNVRLETVASMSDRPSAVAAFKPVKRDALWLDLYEKNKGKIDADFAHRVLTNPEIVLSSSVDAKYTTTDLALQFQSWATFGPSVGVVRYPSDEDQQKTPAIKPLISNPWVILSSGQPMPTAVAKTAVDLHDPNDSQIPDEPVYADEPDTTPAWHGTLLPKSDADIWLTTAFANYERIVAMEKTLRNQSAKHRLSQDDLDTLSIKLFLYRSWYELAQRGGHDFPLSQTSATFRDDKWYDVVTGKGVLLLHALRSRLGEKTFDTLMDKFGLAHAGDEVSTGQFQAFLEKETGLELTEFFHNWLDKTGIPEAVITDQSGMTIDTTGSPFTVFSFDSEVDQSLIVYGTEDDAVANKEAARMLQQALLRRKHNIFAPIMSDKEVTDADLQQHHLVLIGRPSSNALSARFSAGFPVKFAAQSFDIQGKTYAHPESSLVIAGENPLNRRYSMVLVAGLSALGTLTAMQDFSEGDLTNGPVALMPYHQGEINFIPRSELKH